MKTIELYGLTMDVHLCITCGIPFTIPLNVIEKHRENGGFHSCPNGHQQGWEKSRSTREKEKQEQEQTRRERDKLKQQIAQKDDEILAEKAKANKLNKELSRQSKRVHAGVCSCCNRSFQNLKRHMENKHKDL